MAAPAGVAEFQDQVRRATGWRRHATAFVAGAASVLAMAPFHAWPVLLVTLPVLVWLIDGSASQSNRSPSRAAFASGWWFGFGYFVFGLFWIGEAFLVEAEKYALLLPFAVTLLPAGLAFFFAAAAGAARACWPAGLARVLVLAIALGISEWLRGHILTGLPWNTLGYALTSPLPLMQLTSLTGTYSLTLWAVVIFAAPLVMIADGASRTLAATVAIVPLLAAFAFGSWRLSDTLEPEAGAPKIRIVQPSVPQREKWKPENQAAIFKDHIELSLKGPSATADQLEGIALVVWPEAAMPFLPLEEPQALEAISAMVPNGTHLAAGALRLARGGTPPETSARSQRRLYNSLIVFDSEARVAAVYDKNHLVPFGEYLPLAGLWRMFGLRGLVEMRGAFSEGPVPRELIALAGFPLIGPLICYEAIFPGDVVQGIERPQVLLSVTNDGWFGNTTGPRQHFHQARVRAVEEGLPLVRAANNGISAFIDAKGRVVNRLDLNVRGVIDAPLPKAGNPTLYGRYGDAIFVLFLVLLGATAVILARLKRH